MNYKAVTFLIFFHFSGLFCVKVYDFSKNRKNDTILISKLDKFPNVIDSLTVCSFHKQFQINEDYRPIYSIYNDQQFWYSVGLWRDGKLWAKDCSLYNYVLDSITPIEIGNWIKMCMHFDFQSKNIKVSINGRETSIATETSFTKTLTEPRIR